MPNTITLFQKYIDKLDEVYKRAALSGVLDGDNNLVKMGANAHEMLIPKMSMSGLYDYSRENGYTQGSVSLEMETKAFNYDRGTKFTVDAMDDEETAGIAFGQLAAEFVRTQVVPELDAFRFAKYAESAGNTDTGSFTSGTEITAALRTATSAMDEAEVPSENRILFITPTLKGMIDDLDTTKSKAVLEKFSQIIEVPQTRFYTGIVLGEGSYSKALGASDINFLIVHKSAALQYTKHNVNKVISPEANQTSDGYLFFFRSYGITEAYDNKSNGIYCSYNSIRDTDMGGDESSEMQP